MASICRIIASKCNILFCPVRLKCGNAEHNIPFSLLDTGAGICHMTYPLWLNMKLNISCYHNNPQLCNRMGINTPDGMTFDTLPLMSATSTLGDGSQAKVYEIKMDDIQLGLPSLGFNHSINLENITVRLINHDRATFIIGWNVLKYLEINYYPSPDESVCQLSFTENGRKLLEHDRTGKINNYMLSMFNYLECSQ